MASKYRDRTSSSWLHVFNRGADKQDIFSLPGDRDRFESLMGGAALSHGVEIHAYALMTNHFHVLVRAPEGHVSEWAHNFLCAYATGYNYRTKRSGPLFTGRFGSVPVVSDAQLIACARYIHRNPLDLVASDALAAYPYSSLPVYMGRRRSPAWLNGDTLPVLSGGCFMARDIFVDHPDDRLPFGAMSPLRLTTLDELANAVQSTASGAPVSLRRVLEMTLAIEFRVDGIHALAERFGVSAETVRRTARRGRVRLASEHGFQRLRGMVLSELDAA